jgi:hypothetical protein
MKYKICRRNRVASLLQNITDDQFDLWKGESDAAREDGFAVSRKQPYLLSYQTWGHIRMSVPVAGNGKSVCYGAWWVVRYTSQMHVGRWVHITVCLKNLYCTNVFLRLQRLYFCSLVSNCVLTYFYPAFCFMLLVCNTLRLQWYS